MTAHAGFSLVETLVAVSLTLVLLAGLFTALNPAQGAFATEPETADVQQRLRAADDALTRDLSLAGAGPDLGVGGGSLTRWLAPILPFRRGPAGDDDPSVVRTDTITLVYAPPAGAFSTLAADLSPGATTARAAPGGRLAAGMTAVVADGAGGFATLAIVNAGEGGASLQIARSPAANAAGFPSGAPLVQVESRTYSLERDEATGAAQLMLAASVSGADVPVVDHVAGLTFDYVGDPQPPRLLASGDGGEAPRATYGPPPPEPGVRTSAYPPGENCVFTRAASGAVVPRLGVLGDGVTPVALDAARFADGPWCPDAESAIRWDADLLRIRAVGVTLRVESAVDALRGPAGALFSRGGTSREGGRVVPDRQIRFLVAPKNLDLSR